MRLKILLYIIGFLVVQHSIKGQDWTQVSSLPDSFNQTHHSFAFSLNNLGYIYESRNLLKKYIEIFKYKNN